LITVCGGFLVSGGSLLCGGFGGKCDFSFVVAVSSAASFSFLVDPAWNRRRKRWKHGGDNSELLGDRPENRRRRKRYLGWVY